MAKNKFPTYEECKKYVKNKDYAAELFIKSMLNRTCEMFRYDGLPDTIPAQELERLLQTKGNAFVTRVNGNLYALSGDAGGELDAYNRPTLYTVANAALKLSANYKIDVDGILIKNDFSANGMLPVLMKYAALMTDAELSMNVAVITMRILFMISACDDSTKQSANEFVSKINDGDLSVIGESAFFDGVKVQGATTSNTNYLQQFIEVIQYYKASAYNEIGLNANYNMKRERINDSEIALNIDALLPLSENMLNSRREALDKINAMFDTNITVDYNSVWAATAKELNAETEHAETVTVSESTDETETTDSKPEPTGDDTPPTDAGDDVTEDNESDDTATESDDTATESDDTATESDSDESDSDESDSDESEKEKEKKENEDT